MREELRLKLIAHYEETISLVKEVKYSDDAIDICIKRSTQNGICFCASEVFKEIVKIRIDNNSLYMFFTPYMFTYKIGGIEDILKCLIFRLEYLRNLQTYNLTDLK